MPPLAMDLIKKMLSIPPELPLTSTQRFTFLSALIAYYIAGLSMTFAPDLWNAVLQLNLTLHAGRAYFVLVGAGLCGIGLCYVTLSRNKSSQFPHHGPFHGTILSRVLLVNAALIWFYAEKLVNARFALLFSVLDTALSVSTYIIWSQENKNASLDNFFQEVWSTVNPISQKPLRYTIFQVLGFLQFIASFIAPSIMISSGIVPSGISGSHAEGMFRSYFITLTAHAVLHILAAGSKNDSFPIVSVFYRAMWNIPVLLLLRIVSQIPGEMTNILIIYDVTFMVATIALFRNEYRAKTN